MKNLPKILTMIAIASVFTVACNSNAKNTTKLNLQAYRDSVNRAQDSIRLDSFQRAEVIKKEAVQEREARVENSRTVVNRTTVVHETTPAQPAKKGWSSAAKGAVIGGAAGAVTGVLIDKKDGRGAVIGGVVGAGTGYTIGRSKDKKTGRTQ